jgi:hypothetical protein
MAKQVYEFLRAIGCRRLRVSGDKVLATCPFEFEHSSGRDSNPSFVVFAGEKESLWSCSYPHSTDAFAKGSLFSLVRLLGQTRSIPVSSVPWGQWEDRGSSLNSLYRYVWMFDRVVSPRHPDLERLRRLDHVDHPAKIRGRGVAAVDRYAREANKPADKPADTKLSEDFLRRFEIPEGPPMQYLLRERGLDRETIKAWELLYDPSWKRIVIPIRDMAGKLVGVSRRALQGWQKPKYLHSKGFQRRFYLFGEYSKLRAPFDTPKQRGILVEGQFDVIRLWQLGYRNAVALFGADLNHEQLLKCQELFHSVVVLTDGDEAGVIAGAKASANLESAGISATAVIPPDGLDPGDLSFTREIAEGLLGPPDVVDTDPFT